MSDPNGCNNCQRYSKVSASSLEKTPTFRAASDPVSSSTSCGTYSSSASQDASIEQVITAQGRFYPATIKEVIEAAPDCGDEVTATIGTCEPEGGEVHCVDSNAIGNAVDVGKKLSHSWLNQACSDTGVPLARNGKELVKLCAPEGEKAYAEYDEHGNVNLVPQPELCVTNFAQILQGGTLQDPYDTDYYVVASHPTPEDIAEGNYKAKVAVQTGLLNEPSIPVYNPDISKVQHTGLSQLPHCVKGQVPKAGAIELTGFTQIPRDGSCEMVRCEKKLCGSGFVFLEELETASCEDVNCHECDDCGVEKTYVARAMTPEDAVCLFGPKLEQMINSIVEDRLENFNPSSQGNPSDVEESSSCPESEDSGDNGGSGNGGGNTGGSSSLSDSQSSSQSSSESSSSSSASSSGSSSFSSSSNESSAEGSASASSSIPDDSGEISSSNSSAESEELNSFQ